jgi:2-polyprenyl-6-methoxyphenol hydroxylase-like FAD-dependent oxidoreductase
VSSIMEGTTRVLIVGGSLNGLSAALLLAHRGVPCMVVERQDTAHRWPAIYSVALAARHE